MSTSKEKFIQHRGSEEGLPSYSMNLSADWQRMHKKLKDKIQCIDKEKIIEWMKGLGVREYNYTIMDQEKETSLDIPSSDLILKCIHDLLIKEMG